MRAKTLASLNHPHGGNEPRWSADGKQLYYLRSLTSDPQLCWRPLGSRWAGRVVDRDAACALRRPIRGAFIIPHGNVFLYSPHPDGQRFLVNALAEEGEATINVIAHWQKTISDRKDP